MQSTPPVALLAAAVALLALSGCDAIDPYKKAGVWKPVQAAQSNLELQVARPSDLVRGRGTEFADGDTAAQAVDRLRRDKVRPLATITLAPIGGGGAAPGGS